MVDTTDDWIVSRTGIRERHIQKGEGLGTSDMGAEAVKGLLEKTGTKPEEIDLLICATVTPEIVPSDSAPAIASAAILFFFIFPTFRIGLSLDTAFRCPHI